jgi:hypothetical protein
MERATTISNYLTSCTATLLGPAIRHRCMSSAPLSERIVNMNCSMFLIDCVFRSIVLLPILTLPRLSPIGTSDLLTH